MVCQLDYLNEDGTYSVTQLTPLDRLYPNITKLELVPAFEDSAGYKIWGQKETY